VILPPNGDDLAIVGFVTGWMDECEQEESKAGIDRRRGSLGMPKLCEDGCYGLESGRCSVMIVM
jgi:hypothetical protein